MNFEQCALDRYYPATPLSARMRLRAHPSPWRATTASLWSKMAAWYARALAHRHACKPSTHASRSLPLHHTRRALTRRLMRCAASTPPTASSSLDEFSMYSFQVNCGLVALARVGSTAIKFDGSGSATAYTSHIAASKAARAATRSE